MNKAILLFLLFLLIIKCRCENSRSVFLRKFLDIKYVCNQTGCSPSIIIFAKNQVQCEISCLNDLQCYLLTFDLSNNQCIFGNLLWNKTGITVLSSVTSPIATSGVFIDSNDTLYAVDEDSNFVVWKLLKNAANPTIVAGTSGSQGSSSTQLNYPNDVYVDRSGNIYVSDSSNQRIQKFSSGSNVGVTIAGINSSTGSALNQLAYPRYLIFDPTVTYMYIADDNNHRVIRYSTSSTSGTNGTLAAGGAGPNNTNTSLNNPWGIYYLPSISNDLFITNVGGHSVIRWTPGASSGTFVAGVPGVSGSDSTHLNGPMGIRIDNYMNMYVVDYNNHRVQLFCANTTIGITIAGNGSAGNGATQLNYPRGIAFDSAMNMYIGDSSNARVQKFMKL
ncbi:unnamed protein product [Adineta steineri]|uniref:NHL repeat containing protein n=1 Tax=Adineta steineri TaxID=433720 RepID=A0A814PU52_9BILA|nr:unnamed protein product [Adineta steineri]